MTGNIIVFILAILLLLVFVDKQIEEPEVLEFNIIGRQSREGAVYLTLESPDGKILEAYTRNGYTYYIGNKAVDEKTHEAIHTARRQKWSTTAQGA